MGDKLTALVKSSCQSPSSLPLVPTVNFAELQRGNGATLAKILGVSRAAVSKAAREGRIAGPGTDGLYDLRAAVAAWARNTHPGRIRARALRSVNDELAVLRAEINRLETELHAARVQLAAHRAEREAVARAAAHRAADDYAARIGNLCSAIEATFDSLVAARSEGRLDDALDDLVAEIIYQAADPAAGSEAP